MLYASSAGLGPALDSAGQDQFGLGAGGGVVLLGQTRCDPECSGVRPRHHHPHEFVGSDGGGEVSLIEDHYAATGSLHAAAILNDWETRKTAIRHIVPFPPATGMEAQEKRA